MAGFAGAGGQAGIDVVQAGMAIDARLAFAEQVQIGPMQYQDVSHAMPLPEGRTVWGQGGGVVQTIAAT
ncbi:hypothetical protein GCM10027193_18100 [Arenimonas aestuarii]